LKARYRAGKVGDVEVKTKLAAAVNALLDPIRERRAAVPGAPRLLEGSASSRARARPVSVAQETMGRVREAVKLAY
jgi:tryptophanyl-tRNA synthetase